MGWLRDGGHYLGGYRWNYRHDRSPALPSSTTARLSSFLHKPAVEENLLSSKLKVPLKIKRLPFHLSGRTKTKFVSIRGEFRSKKLFLPLHPDSLISSNLSAEHGTSFVKVWHED